MEGGGVGSNLLDPAASEFYPSTTMTPAPANNFAFYLGPAQVFYQPYAPPLHSPAAPMFHHPPPPVPAPAQPGVATRAVSLSMLPRGIGEAELRAEMEAFGGVRRADTAALAAEGAATVHFYDLRSAQAAVAEIQQQYVRWQQARCEYGVAAAGNWVPPATAWGYMGLPAEFPVGDFRRGLIAGQAVWAEFASSALLNDPNQGSIVVLNSDPGVSLLALRQLFEAFGAVKEVREMSSKPHHRFVEFFDTRDAGRAFSELNGRVIHGWRLVLEFTRTGNQARPLSNYSKRSSSSHYSSKMPPRLQRGNSSQQSSKWPQGDGVTPRSFSSSSSSSSSVAVGDGSNREGKGGVVLLKRTTHGSSSNSNISERKNKSSSINSSKNMVDYKYPSSSSASSSSSALKQQQRRQQSSSSSSRKGWKNQPKNGVGGGESRFLFKEEGWESSSASLSRDSRTTVMIKNIPNKYSQKLLLHMLDNHCIHCNEQIAGGDGTEPYSAFDFVYLPIDFHNKCNVGYGFVNLTSPEAAFRLYKAFHDQPWEVFNSRKICQVTYARLQGLEALKEHFRNSKFACDNDEYLPVVFSPPRDGKQLTEPVPVVCRESISLTNPVMGTDEAAAALGADFGGASSTTASTHAPSDNADCDDEDGDGGLSEALAKLFPRAK